jgi:hypothetical protein
MRFSKFISVATALWIIGCSSASFCSTVSSEDQQAQQLLSNAVEYYRVQGDSALAAFSRQGEFIDGEHYVFVVDTHGTMLASGGASAVLIGRDVSKVLEPELRAAFAQALKSPEGIIGTAKYRWMNVRDGRVEQKQVYYQRVGDRVIAVGDYLPRASPDQAKDLLERASSALKKDPQVTLRSINDLSANFREDDLYVFVVDLKSHRYLAHGYNVRLLGVDFTTIKDPEGKPVGVPILAMVGRVDSGGYDYRWRNPVTGKVEDKHALFRKVGNYLVAVGYYVDPR